MLSCTQTEIDRLQNNLQTIRQAGGWSTAAFGELLGVSKQTVCNLENGTSKMNKLQYIGIRTILDYEIEQEPDNKILFYAVHHLLDSERISDEELKKTKQAIAYASGAKSLGYDAAMLAAGLVTILGAAALQIMTDDTVVNQTTKWLKKFMKID